MNKDAYYFPHFSNARHDRRVRRLRKELGVEGYGIFFMLLEVLREQADFMHPIQDLDLLADEFGTSEQKVRTVISNYGLFEITEDQDGEECFTSPRQVEYLEPYFRMKEQRREASKKAVEARKKKAIEKDRPTDDRSVTDRSSPGDRPPTKVKKSKVKKSKEEKKTPQPAAEDTRNARLLYDLITAREPRAAKEESVPRWADDTRKARELDGWTPREIEKAIRSAQGDDFWQGNILSGAKLRKHMVKLLAIGKKGSGPDVHPVNNQEFTYEAPDEPTF